MTYTGLITRFTSLLVTLALLAFCSCAKRGTGVQPDKANPQIVSSHAGDDFPININQASVSELKQLPGIGTVLAERIVAHRERYGPFRKPEHLMMVRGISDRRFRKLSAMVAVE